MDIPLPDELEWLEAQSHLHYEDPVDLDPPEYYPPDHDDPRPPPLPQPPSPPSVQPQTNGHKRPLPLKASLFSDQSNEKRARTADELHDDDGDDWLRYSPPRDETNRKEQEDEGEVNVVAEPEEVTVSRFASRIDGECMPVTAPSGDRVYAKVCRFDVDARTTKLEMKSRSGGKCGLISEPVDVLLQRCEQEAFAKALHANSEHQNDIILPETPVIYEKLWVDKYAPSSFTELLSDEQTNREVLLWLKRWDSCVFGSEIRSTADDVLNALRRHSSATQLKKNINGNFAWKSKEQRWSRDSSRNMDNIEGNNSTPTAILETWKNNSRITSLPEQKILLLCGPPGLGKTTLAHVAAKHCGYHVVEINASDDRSSSMIESKILDAVQMNSVTSDSKPKCLIIDEIDGALGDGKGAVEAIVKMVSAERKLDEGKMKGELGKISKKRGKTPSLLRPVICICNDLYAPALRPLRQIAKVHIFVQPSVNRVVNRLRFICSKEGMKASSIALTALAEYTECDMRSCLNTLQFLNKKKETLNVLDIDSQVVGRKDMSRSIFDIWKEIFQKRKVKQASNCINNSSGISSEFHILHSLISNRGDFDLVLDGVHENILQLSYHDPVMRKTVDCLNNIGFSDVVHQYTMRSQQMHLQVYHPSVAVSIHRLVAQVQKPNIQWPKSHQRYRTTLMERAETLRGWRFKIAPSLSRHFSMKSFILDLVSPMLHMLSPPNLRPVAVHLLTESENRDLCQLITRMVSYSLTYKNLSSYVQPSWSKQEVAVEATLILDPPLCDYVNFKDYESSPNVLGMAMKQYILHEVEKQKILQGAIEKPCLPDGCKNGDFDITEQSLRAKPTTQGVTMCTGASKETGNSKSSKCDASAYAVSSSFAPSKVSPADVKAKKDAKRTRGFNFFDRFRKTNSLASRNYSDDAIQKPASLERDLHPLLFKFNEGFTNAIKRPVKMHEFML